jgi:MSHA biogenesis protein MshE
MQRPGKIRLGQTLLQQQLLTVEQVAAALKEQQRSGRKLGRVLVEQGYATEEQISGALALQLGIRHLDLKLYSIKPEIVRLLPETQARRFRALVLDDLGAELLVGMSDPTDLFAYDEIERLLKRRIEFVVVNEADVLEAIDRIYLSNVDITDLARELKDDLGDVSIDFGGMADNPALEEAPIVKLLQSVFDDATRLQASDIHIEPQESRLQIRFRIDGVLTLQTEADIKIAASLALRLKLMADLNIAEKRLPQDGRFAIKVKQQRIDVRISTMPTQYGESVVMRLLNQASMALRLNAIGMPDEMVARFRSIIARPNGLVLVTGPTGSGKTTTLYCALAELNSVEKKLITVEDPIEYRLTGINQVQVNDKIDLTFAKVLRSALRQDPDILLVGEMRDQETAEIGLRAAMTGHLVLSTLHTNDAISTPLRLIDMGVQRFKVGSSLQAVVAQRLVRIICDACKVPHALLPTEREWLRLELRNRVSEYDYFAGKGCSRCNSIGYRGRTGVYEMLEMTTAVVDATHDPDPTQFIKAAQAQMAGQTLRRHAVSLVVAGRTSVAEAMRVSNQRDE